VTVFPNARRLAPGVTPAPGTGIDRPSTSQPWIRPPVRGRAEGFAKAPVHRHPCDGSSSHFPSLGSQGTVSRSAAQLRWLPGVSSYFVSGGRTRTPGRGVGPEHSRAARAGPHGEQHALHVELPTPCDHLPQALPTV
jgi:hypothetical protein